MFRGTAGVGCAARHLLAVPIHTGAGGPHFLLGQRPGLHTKKGPVAAVKPNGDKLNREEALEGRNLTI